MPPDDTEIIDLTQDSPVSTKQHFIELDSDGEIVELPIVNGKASARKRRKPRRKKAKDVEEGEVTQTSVDASREQSPQRERTNGVGGGSRRGATRDAQAAQAKSLIERLSGPMEGTGKRSGRNEDTPKERTRRSKRRKDQQADLSLAKDDTRRRSRSPDRLRNPRDSRLPAKEIQTRENGTCGRQRREQSSERSARELRAFEPTNSNNLFFEDVARSEVPSTVKIREQPTKPAQTVEVLDEPSAALLLPAHVSVLDQDIVVNPHQAVPPAESDSDDEGGIEYLDYDDDRRVRRVTLSCLCVAFNDFMQAGMVRYFETVDEDGKAARPKTIVCKKCGAEGEHRTYDCPVIIVSMSLWSLWDLCLHLLMAVVVSDMWCSGRTSHAKLSHQQDVFQLWYEGAYQQSMYAYDLLII